MCVETDFQIDSNEKKLCHLKLWIALARQLQVNENLIINVILGSIE